MFTVGTMLWAPLTVDTNFVMINSARLNNVLRGTILLSRKESPLLNDAEVAVAVAGDLINDGGVAHK